MELVTINGKEYSLASLRMKHLKQLANLISTPKTGLLDRLTMWYPFIEYSIKEGGAPDFDVSELDELKIDDLVELWTSVQKATGITISPKGESQPKAPIGESSTASSALPSAGTTA